MYQSNDQIMLLSMLSGVVTSFEWISAPGYPETKPERGL